MAAKVLRGPLIRRWSTQQNFEKKEKVFFLNLANEGPKIRRWMTQQFEEKEKETLHNFLMWANESLDIRW